MAVLLKSVTEFVFLLMAIVGLIKVVLDFFKKVVDVVGKGKISFPAIQIASLLGNTIDEAYIAFAIVIYILVIVPQYLGKIFEDLDIVAFSVLPPILFMVWGITYLSNKGLEVFWVVFINLLGLAGCGSIILNFYLSSAFDLSSLGKIATLLLFAFPVNVFLLSFNQNDTSMTLLFSILITLLDFLMFCSSLWLLFAGTVHIPS